MARGAAAPRSRRVELGTGLGVHLLEWGADDPARDHTVVLLHGFLDLAWAWTPVVDALDALGARFHLVAPDFRGHGDSDRIGAGGYYHFLDYLADLEDLLPRLGRARISLVGHSMGGSVAGYFAGAFPDRLHRVALLEGLGPPEGEGDVAGRIETWVTSWKRARARPQRGYASIDEAAARLRAVDPRLDEAQGRFLAEHGTRRGADGRLVFKHDPLHVSTGPLPFRVELAASFWRRITCPILLVEGADTEFRYAPEDAARREAALHGFTKVVLPDAGHMMHRHQPALLAAALVDFLA
jgi:pimeloyl-ACP methyl ester carboxylesterase